MKKLKMIAILSILFITVALNIVQQYLLQQNIEYNDRLIVIRIILTWFVSPFLIVKCYNDIVTTKIDDAKVRAAIYISTSIYVTLIVIAFVIRILFFVILEDRAEIPLTNGLIMVRREIFTSQETFYYQPINYFLYERVPANNSTGNNTGDSSLQSNNNLASSEAPSVEPPSAAWIHLPENLFSSTASEADDIHFLITTGVSFEDKFIKTELSDTNLLLDLFRNIPVKEHKIILSSADYYLLLRDGDEEPICLIEIWENYICIDQVHYYEISDNELFATLNEVYDKSDALEKIAPQEVLLSTPFTSSGEFTQENIISYKEKPAIILETGYDNVRYSPEKSSTEKYDYERILLCEGMYFDTEYKTAYLISQYIIYYNEDGSIFDSFYKRLQYYDYFTGEDIGFIL